MVTTFTKGVNVRSDQLTLNTAAVTITAKEHAGRALLLDKADGITCTLPPATGSGDKYRFIVKTTVTSNDYIIQVANASDTMIGEITGGNTTGGSGRQEAAGGTDDTITMDGSTRGGIEGSVMLVEDLLENKWLVNGWNVNSGTVANTFSATVS